MNKLYSLLFINLLLISVILPGFTQEIIPFKNAKGVAFFTGDYNISKKNAIENAINEIAIKNNIPEKIQTSQVLFVEENDSVFYDDYTRIVTSDLKIDFAIDTIIDKKSTDKFGNWQVEVFIDGSIYKYPFAPDYSFDFQVNGINNTYNHPYDSLYFYFTPHQEGFLTIFNYVTGTECKIIYPKTNGVPSINDKIGFLFKKDTTYKMPMSPGWNGYWPLILPEEIISEKNQLIFVFSKKNNPLSGKIDYKKMLHWIYSIPCDERKVKFFEFIIKK